MLQFKFFHDQFILNEQEVIAIIGKLMFDIYKYPFDNLMEKYHNILYFCELICEFKLIERLEKYMSESNIGGYHPFINFAEKLKLEEYYGFEKYKQICEQNQDSHLYYLKNLFKFKTNIAFRNFEEDLIIFRTSEILPYKINLSHIKKCFI